MTTKGLQIDQVADAFVNVPGVVVTMLDHTPASTYATTSSSFVDVDATVTGSFVAPAAGTYLLDLQMDMIISDTSSTARYRFVIDAGLPTEQVAIDDNSMANMQSANSATRQYKSVQYVIALTAGLHTIKPQWRVQGGSATISVTGGSKFRVVGTLVSGSGAGGAIGNSTNTAGGQTVSVTQTPTPTWQDLGSLTFTSASSERVMLHHVGAGALYTIGNVTMYLRLTVDDVEVCRTTAGMVDQYETANLSLSVLTSELTSGSHTLKLQGAKYASGDQNWTYGGGKLQVTQFRGGLVPWERDGVQVLDTPRAINIVGGAMSVSNDGTGRLDIELPEAVTASGVSIEMLNRAPTTVRSTTSSTFVGVGYPAVAEPGDIFQVFDASAAGTYQIFFHNFAYHSGGNWAKFRLVFDYDTTPIYVGDDSWWMGYSGSSFVMPGEFVATVELSAGSHKVKAEWLTIGGTLYTANTLYNWKVQGLLVSGSGAGGVLGQSAAGTSLPQVIDTAYDTTGYEDVVGCSITQAVATGDKLQINVQGWGLSAGNPCTMKTRVYLTGPSTVVLLLANQSTSVTSVGLSVGGAVLTPALLAGTYTIKLQAAKYSTQANWSIYEANIDAMLFRGGLVPVRKDGTSVIDTPAALNFTGPNVNVTNIGGTANISLSGVTGTIASTPWWSAIPADDSPSVTPTLQSGNYTVGCRFGVYKAGTKITGVSFYSMKAGSHTIRCKLWKYAGSTLLKTVDVVCTGPGRYDGYFSTPYEVSASEAPETQFYATMWETSGTNWTDIPSSPYGDIAYPMRGHMYWDRSKNYASGDAFPSSISASQTYPVDPILEIAGDPAGQVIPENIPILEYSTSSVVNVKAAPGASTALGMVLNNGVRYTATSPLTVNLALSGLGGLDTGTEAISTWYYIYAVPSGVGYGFSTLCSVSPPSTGPTGYPIWRYLGAFYNNSGGNIRVFTQIGAWFYSRDITDSGLNLYTSDARPIQNTWTSCTAALAIAVPVSVAGSAQISGFLDSDGGQVPRFWFEPGEPPAFTPTGTTAGSAAAFLTAQDNSQITNEAIKPLFNGTMSWYYFEGGSTANLNIGVKAIGWQDKYLSGLTSQLQAKYEPDTKSPKGSWTTATTIAFGARPGQPSTTRLTLQDGTQRVMTTGTWDVANGVADWGYDEAASQGNGKWLYFYAVPKSGDDSQVVVRASDNAPSTGPTGYTNFKLVWADYIDGSGNLKEIVQSGNRLSYIVGESFYSVSTYAPDGSPVSTPITDYVPASASRALLGSTLYGPDAPPDDSQWVMRWYWDSGGTKQLWGTVVAGEAGSYRPASREMVELPVNSTRTIYRQMVRVLGTAASAYLAHAEVYCWIDEWIDP